MRNPQIRDTITYHLLSEYEKSLNYQIRLKDGRLTGLRKIYVKELVNQMQIQVDKSLKKLEDNELASYFITTKEIIAKRVEKLKAAHIFGELSHKCTWFN